MVHTVTGPMVIEARALSGPAGGVVRYIRGLLRGLHELQPALPLLVFTDHPRGLARMHEEDQTTSTHSALHGISVGPSGDALRLWWDMWALPRAVRKLRPQLLHRTKPAGTPFRAGLPPTIVTIYDVIPLEHPSTQTFAQRLYWNIQLPLAVRTAQHIVTISEASKHSIVERLSVPESRVTVTLPGVDTQFTPPAEELVVALRERFRIPGPYLLTVGTIEPRKNVDALLRGFSLVVRDIPHTLVIAGRWGWRTDAVRRALADPRIQGRVVLLGPVAPADLPVLYGGADAFVFLSRAEGFGFPPLEAMACGTPVLCSAAGSLGEIVGSASLPVNPSDERAIAEGLVCIVSDAPLRERLRRDGMARSASFTWRRTAAQTLEVYATVIRNTATS